MFLACISLFGATKEECELYRDIDHYLLLLQKWMGGVQESAKWRWNHALVEHDIEGEQLLVEMLTNMAMINGVPRDYAFKVIQAQIEAGNMIMDHNFEQWSQQGVREFEEAWDMFSELHPYMSMITSEMFFLLGKLYPQLKEYEGEDALFQPPLSRRPIDQIPYPAWQKALSVLKP